jgi:hypothetical protein
VLRGAQAWTRRDKGAAPQRPVIEEQRGPRLRFPQPAGRKRIGVGGGVARSLQPAAGLLVALAWPPIPILFRATLLSFFHSLLRRLGGPRNLKDTKGAIPLAEGWPALILRRGFCSAVSAYHSPRNEATH